MGDVSERRRAIRPTLASPGFYGIKFFLMARLRDIAIFLDY